MSDLKGTISVKKTKKRTEFGIIQASASVLDTVITLMLGQTTFFHIIHANLTCVPSTVRSFLVKVTLRACEKQLIWKSTDHLCISTWRSDCSTRLSLPIYFRYGNIYVMQHLEKPIWFCPWSFWVSSDFLFGKQTLKKVSVSPHQGKQSVVILWHFAALHQPLSTALCSFSSLLLLRHSQLFTPFSQMTPLKHPLRTKTSPNHPPHPKWCHAFLSPKWKAVI